MTTPVTSIRDGMSASRAAHATPDSAGQPTDPAGSTGRLSSWLANTTLDDVPATVRERAKHLILWHPRPRRSRSQGTDAPINEFGRAGPVSTQAAGTGEPMASGASA
jgi:hypothetical protein